jgi:hypothetical protein
MTSRTRRLLLWAGAGTAGVAVLLLHFKERDSYRCQECFAKKDVFQWRLGFWMGASIPLSPPWTRIFDTCLHNDYFATGHSHDWKFAQGSPYHFFGTTWGGCALGGGRHVSDLCQIYESSREFRDFIHKKIESGSLTQSNFLSLASNFDRAKESPIHLAAQSLLDSYFEK